MQPRSARVEDDDDKDLKLALQMSLEEARRSGIVAEPASSRPEPSKSVTQPIVPQTQEAEDESLRAAIAASLKDMENHKTAMDYPSVQHISSPHQNLSPPKDKDNVSSEYPVPSQMYLTNSQVSNNELSPLEAENITLFATLIERMQASPPGAILREPRIQELYEAVSALKPKLGRTLSTVVGTYGKFVSAHP